MTGTTVGVLDAKTLQGVSITSDGLTTATSGADGSFTVQSSAAGDFRATFSSTDVFDRRTTLHIPGSGVRVSLIPKSFDLTAFDQMFRQTLARLQRWTKAPNVVIVATELTFSSLSATSYTATGTRLSDADVSAISADLATALPQLTGNTFSAFASTTVETPSSGATISVQRDGVIVAARYQGLTESTGFAGYGRAASTSDGTVTAGIISYDADVDRSAAVSVRHVLHMHELGHALGYSHVMSRPSVMNPSPSIQPNDFDREAARVAFDRQPGSVSPDTDPLTATTTSLLSNAAVTWSPAVP